jgi:hypothetical protein
MPAIIIDMDSYKEKIEGYEPDHAQKVQTESAKLANKEFEKCLKLESIKEIILICGGSASGKTEFIDWHLKTIDNTLIFDSTLSSYNGAINKIRPTLKKGKKIRVILILPSTIESAYIAYLKKKKKVPCRTFY